MTNYINSETIKKINTLYKENLVARNLFDWAAARQRNAKETTIDTWAGCFVYPEAQLSAWRGNSTKPGAASSLQGDMAASLVLSGRITASALAGWHRVLPDDGCPTVTL